MSSTAKLQTRPLKRGQAVRLVQDIPGHPSGSTGKVAIANGMTWLRYWVRFSDGSSVGHIDHTLLVRAKDYEAFLASRQVEAVAAAHEADELVHSGNGDDDLAGAGAAASGAVVINGVTIPQLLLERAKAARTRLGG